MADSGNKGLGPPINRRALLHGGASLFAARAVPLRIGGNVLESACPATTIRQASDNLLRLLGALGLGDNYASESLPEPMLQFQMLHNICLSADAWNHSVLPDRTKMNALQLEVYHPEYLLDPTSPYASYHDARALHDSCMRVIKQYKTCHDVIAGIQEDIKNHLPLYRQAAGYMEQHYPQLFVKASFNTLDLSEILLHTCRGIRGYSDVEHYTSLVWKAYGKLTGIVPPEASAEAREEITRFISQPGYRPYLSKEAEFERLQEACEQMHPRITQRQESLDLYYAADLHTPETTRDAIVYRVTLPPAAKGAGHIKVSPQRLADFINTHYPFEQALSTAFVQGDSQRAHVLLDGTLRIIEPPAELAQWLDRMQRNTAASSPGFQR